METQCLSIASYVHPTCIPQIKTSYQRSYIYDPQKAIPYNTVIPLTLSSSSGSSIVNLVMLDANHCPGSSMFLLWSPFPPFTSVLHTGDMRADDGFIQDLIRNPLVQPFFQGYPVKAKTGSGRIMKDKRIPVSGSSQRFFEGDVYRNTGDVQTLHAGGGTGLRRQLDRIYLDTSLLVGSCDMPSREEAIGNLIHLINGFPADTTFHLHCWTFGYEEVLKALARTYDTKIHLDRWQLQNHLLLQGDPLLQQLGTSDPSSLFHACERSGGGCETIKTSRNRVVRVEFVEEHVVEHAIKMKHIAAQMVSAQAGEAEWPSKIVSRCVIDSSPSFILKIVSHSETVLSPGATRNATRARGLDQSVQASVPLPKYPDTATARMRLLYDETRVQECGGRWRGEYQAGMSRMVCTGTPLEFGSGCRAITRHYLHNRFHG